MALLWHPIQFPLTNILVKSLFYRMTGSREVRSSTPKSSRISISVLFGEPTDTRDINDRFLTKPQAWPSGVSAGQTIPQWELWS